MIEPFVIATLPEGLGRIGICRLPGRSGDLDGDIAAIRAWGPAIVLSLAEMGEMDDLGASNLPARLAASGIAWRHFPIADFGVPPADAEPAWRALAAEIHGALDAGLGVLVHCRGGLGRSGMIVARLLAERGETAPIDRVRRARPGAVETEDQAAWIGAAAAKAPRA